MRRIYKIVVTFAESLPFRIHLIKMIVAEWYAIWRKRKIYQKVVWTGEQQKEFDEFWIKNYGRKIPNKWHRLYESMNGTFDIRYFPEIFFTTKFEPMLNPYNKGVLLQDKSLVELLFNGESNDITFPETYVLCCSGIFYDGRRTVISRSVAADLLLNIGAAVIKITIGSSSGKDVKMVNFGIGKIETREQILQLFNSFGTNFIVQERIKQHPAISNIYSQSINTFRVMTYILDGVVLHAPVSMRIGAGGRNVDNIHSGGIAIGVSDDGILEKYAYRLGYGDTSEKYDKHPDSGILFDQYRISFVPKIIKSSHELHGRLPHIGIVSWDFAVNDMDKIVLIEVNLLGQSSWFPQIICGRSFFGENTEKVLNKISKVK